MSDAFFTLARLPEGVTCFFVPRSLADGSRNAFYLQRLKDKCGNRSNASSEVEYRDTAAWLVGEPGRGIATLIEMAHHTRFDIVVGVAGMMRAGLNQAIHHARHRSAFGKRLEEHALMANVLADLALETEAAMLMAFRLAAAFDASGADAKEYQLQRVLTPIAKYWLCKRVTALAVEAMECLGGNGYVEEGSPEALTVLADEIAVASDARIAHVVARARRLLADPAGAQRNARTIVEMLALAVEASLMKRYSEPAAAEAFSASRLDSPGSGHAFGTLPGEIDAHALVERARLCS